MSKESVLNLKQEAVNALVDKMQKAKSVVIAEYRGLTVEKTEDLRRQLRKEGCEMIVVKNNISRRAAETMGYGNLDNDLAGPNSVVLAYEDSVAAAKILHGFAKKNVKLVVKSGIVDGDFYNDADIKQIAQLPNKDTLLAMFATQLYAPLRDLAIGLDMMVNKE